MNNAVGSLKTVGLAAVLLIGINANPAFAGWMDNLNQATQTFHQLQSASQAASQAGGILKAGAGALHSGSGNAKGSESQTNNF